ETSAAAIPPMPDMVQPPPLVRYRRGNLPIGGKICVSDISNMEHPTRRFDHLQFFIFIFRRGHCNA
ncbi:MAG: hypothetical protein EBR82_54825, partial [Caulobacteraceae bacterium]|nr:hypothetical protein [Caulobacteraceae bacterium]